MTRFLALAVLLALSACSPQAPEAVPTTPPAATPAPSAAPAASPAPSASTQSETEQATNSQESPDGAAAAPDRSDASLEKMAALPPTAQLPDGPWKAGENYTVLVPAQPTSVDPGTIEVLEFNWLACPHCYALEPHIKNWLKTKPSYVHFVQVPVMWDAMHRAHAHFFYTAKALGRDDLIAKAMDTIQTQHVPLAGNTDAESLQIQQAFAVQNGVSADDFAKAYNSFSVNSDMQRAEQLGQRYQVQGVPFIVVNGKYTTDVAHASGGNPAGAEEKLIALINDLIAAEHRH